MILPLAPYPRHNMHFIPAGVRRTGRRGLGQTGTSVPGIFQGGTYFQSLAAGINTLPSNLLWEFSQPTSGSQQAVSSAASLNLGGTITGILENYVQKATDLVVNSYQGAFSGGSPLTADQVQLLKNQMHADNAVAAAGNATLLAQANAQGDAEINAAVNSVPAGVSIPSLASLGTTIAGTSWWEVGLIGGGIVVLLLLVTRR